MNDKCASGTGATIDKCLIKAGARRGWVRARVRLLARRKAKALSYPPHVVAGTAANQVLALAGIARL